MSLVCPINSLGYGISSYNIWKNLRDYYNISLFPLGSVSIENHWNKEEIIKDIDNQKYYNKTLPCLKIWHANDLIMKPHGSGKYSIYTFFETTKITDNEKVGYDITDTIIVPTKWAKDILINNNIDSNKIFVIPPGVDLSIFDQTLEIKENDKTDDYVFINIGKWEIRKGHDVLVHIFNQAFEKKDNVRLLMINNNPFISEKENQQWQNLYKNTKLGDKIYIIPRLSSQLDIAKVIGISNCGIYPARAEGWNNEVIETMAMNKPVIVTNYSAHTEYANTDNSYLIDITDHEPAEDGKFFNGLGVWAKLDTQVIEQTISHMRYVYKNRISTNPIGLQTAQKFSWSSTAEKISNII
jgi:glycosyltransferase involved in cell wall biosynthesis